MEKIKTDCECVWINARSGQNILAIVQTVIKSTIPANNAAVMIGCAAILVDISPGARVPGARVPAAMVGRATKLAVPTIEVITVLPAIVIAGTIEKENQRPHELFYKITKILLTFSLVSCFVIYHRTDIQISGRSRPVFIRWWCSKKISSPLGLKFEWGPNNFGP